MASKEKMVAVYPDKELLKKIEAKAKEEARGTGPMVREIVRRWFAAEQKEA